VPRLAFRIFDYEGLYVGKVLPLASVTHASVVETVKGCIAFVTVATGISEGVYVCLEPSGGFLVFEGV